MSKVTSTKNIHFPKLNWGINAGEERELPADKEAQARILAEPGITPVSGVAKKETEKEIKNND